MKANAHTPMFRPESGKQESFFSCAWQWQFSGTFGMEKDTVIGTIEWIEQLMIVEGILFIWKLYKVESYADDKGLSTEERMGQRRKISYPTILMFEKWIEETYAKVLPKSRLGEALAYAYSLLPRMSRYVNDSMINIDNNLIENAIRPLALGRLCWHYR